MSRAINTRCGGAIIAPWDIDQLDDDWIAAFMESIPQSVEQHNREVQRHRDAFYKKYLPRYRH